MDFRQEKTATRFPANSAIPVMLLFLAASLAGCGGDSRYQESLVEAAETRQGALSLPRGEGTGGPVPLWDEVLVVCPYQDTDLVPERFAEGVRNLDTTNDSVQWLVFSGNDDVGRVSVERSAVDFCQGPDAGGYDHNQAWTAEMSESIWVMTALAD